MINFYEEPPHTVEAAINRACSNLEQEEIDYINENGVWDLHHTMGRSIRNYWLLWDKDSDLHKDFNSIGLFHPDDMSSLIMYNVDCIVKGIIPNNESQIWYYYRHWLDWDESIALKMQPFID